MSALLKEHYHSAPSVHARRIDNAHWAGVAQELRSILDGAFKAWEVEAIVGSLMDIVQRREALTVPALEQRLHAKQFSRGDALTIASAIVKAYG